MISRGKKEEVKSNSEKRECAINWPSIRPSNHHSDKSNRCHSSHWLSKSNKTSLNISLHSIRFDSIRCVNKLFRYFGISAILTMVGISQAIINLLLLLLFLSNVQFTSFSICFVCVKLQFRKFVQYADRLIITDLLFMIHEMCSIYHVHDESKKKSNKCGLHWTIIYQFDSFLFIISHWNEIENK